MLKLILPAMYRILNRLGTHSLFSKKNNIKINTRHCAYTISTGARRGKHKATVFLPGQILSIDIGNIDY